MEEIGVRCLKTRRGRLKHIQETCIKPNGIWMRFDHGSCIDGIQVITESGLKIYMKSFRD